MIKLIPFMSKLFSVSNGSSFLAVPVFIAFIGRWLVNLFNIFANWLVSASWSIIKFVLGLMEALEYVINSFLGLKTVTLENGTTELRGTSIQDMVDYAKDMDNGPEFLDILTKTFRALMVVAIVLLIIFTIVAIVKQEYANATSGSFDPQGNDKKPIITGMFKKMLYIVLLPLTMMFILTGVNSILASFSTAMQGGQHMTVASQVLASSTYDSNKYRYYAQQGKRIPILIKAYDADAYKADEDELLMQKISSSQVQLELKRTASQIATNTTLDFVESVTYKNNKLTNSTAYGDIYEKFVCTAEQYQIMADFIDYAQKNKTSFQVKSIDDPNIEWKYVDSAVFNASDVSLTINYRDASDINGNGKTSDSYTIEYSSGFDVTTPISDAMDSIMALLGIGDYSDYLYKTMERDENSVNVVQWQNEKVLIKFSDGMEFSNPATWNRIDQLIIYEYYHFSSNNTFQNYTLNDLKEGVELDACQINYRVYYAEANSYSSLKTQTCVKINGSYYYTEKDPSKTDKYGNVYYVLKDAIAEGEDGRFLNGEYATIEKQSDSTKAQLKLTGRSNNFNINDPNTWNYADQIIIYEFYKDLTYKNDLYAYDFKDFYTGVELDVYKIEHFKLGNRYEDGTYRTETSSNRNADGYYVLINGTYYNLNSSTSQYQLYKPTGANFLSGDGTTYEANYYYNYEIKLSDNGIGEKYGISTTGSTLTADKFFIKDVSADQYESEAATIDNATEAQIANVEKYSSFAIKFSDNFNYEDVDTWTYRDYFLFYLYINYNGIAGNLGIESLKASGVLGDTVSKLKVKDSSRYVSTADTYYRKVKYKTEDGKDLYLYINLDMVMNISEELMNCTLNSQNLLQRNLQNDFADLFITVNTGNLNNSNTEMRTFEFSDYFSVYTPANWTVLDYILYSFSQDGTIGDVSTIQENGYNALVYKTAYDDPTTNNDETEVLYKFGNRTNDSKDKYLSLKKVRALKNYNGNALNFESVDQFLNCSLIDYISLYLGLSKDQIITDEKGIINNLYYELRQYIYDVDQIIEEVLDGKSFKLSSGTGTTIDVFDNVTQVTYKSKAKLADLSTWTNFDAIMYYLTGSIRDSYTGNVILYGDKKYFIYGNYAINISSDGIQSNIADNNTITSRELPDDVVEDDYYDNYLVGYVKTAEEVENSGKISKYSTASFKYTKGAKKTILDLIYNKITGSDIPSTQTFEAYTNGTNIYIKVGSNYVLVSSIYDDYISISIGGTLTLVNSLKIATKDGTYTAFDNTIDDSTTDFSSLNYTKIDSLIMSLTNSSEKTVYNIYKVGREHYIYVKNSFLRIQEETDDVLKTSLASSADEFGTIDNIDSKTEITALYNNYYKTYVTKTVNNIQEESSQTIFECMNLSASINKNIHSITPLNLILIKLGLVKTDVTEVKGNICTASSRKYFKVEVDGVNYYINITDIAGTYQKEGDTENWYLRDTATSKYELILRYIYVCNSNSQAIRLSLNRFSEYLSGRFVQNTHYKKDYSILKTGITDGTYNLATDLTSLADAETWNYLNLFIYSLSSSLPSNSQVVYIDANGNKYIKLEVNSRSYYIKVGDSSSFYSNLLKNFESESVETNYKNGETYSRRGIIIYKLLNVNGVYIPLITTSDSTKKFYFLSDDNGKNINAIYYGTSGLYNNDTITPTTTAGDYLYTFNGLTSNFADLTLFDFIIAIFRNNSVAKEIKTKLYIFDTDVYMYFDSAYLNIGKLGISINANITTDTNLSVSGNSAKKLKDLIVATGTGTSTAFEGHRDSAPIVATPPATGTDEDVSIDADNDGKLKFSDGFVIYDYSTWMLSDYILYYMFYEHSDYFEDTNDSERTYKNFYQLVSQGYAPGEAKDYVVEDEYGNATHKSIYLIGSMYNNSGLSTSASIQAVDASIFRLCYSRTFNGVYNSDGTYNEDAITRTDKVTLKGLLGTPSISSTTNLNYGIQISMNVSDFVYNNYYYFNYKNGGLSIINKLQDSNVSKKNAITNGSAKTTKALNIALSEGFDINNLSTWTLLDFIIVYEFSNTAVRHNYFEGVSFSDLTIESELPIFEFSDGTLLIEINGNCYNLTKFDGINSESSLGSIRDCKTIGGKSVADIIEKTNDDSAVNLRVLYETIDYTVKNNGDTALNYGKTADSILFSKGEDITYMTVNTNVVDNYKVNIANLGCGDNYSITTIIREVNWPQKLMNDMQVIYPDLNWATLIATDGWLDMLGTFTSAQASGEFVTEGNSANITAVGLVLSEFFVSNIKTDETNSSVYEYESVYDEHVIKALMLALLGEDEYNDLSMQAEVFIEMFNNMFLPVLEDIAHERGEELTDGKVDSFYTSVYKAYLATVLLSSDMGEYFYKIATRVYAQYTILDALASASGDYAAYLNYINTSSNESGDDITAFKYADFHTLCVYENSFTGNANPTYTFSFEKSIKGLYGEGVTYEKLSNAGYSFTGTNISYSNDNDEITTAHIKQLFSNETVAGKSNFAKLRDILLGKYEEIYLKKNARVSDLNTGVIGLNEKDSLNISGIYCFMFDAYYSIRQNLQLNNKNNPVYIDQYYLYLTGKLDRWEYTLNVSTDSASGYIPDMGDYEKLRKQAKKDSKKAAFSIYIPNLKDASFDFDDDETTWEKFKDIANELTLTSWKVLEKTFCDSVNNMTDVKRAFWNVIDKDNSFLSTNDLINIKTLMNESEEGNTEKKYKNKTGSNSYEMVDAWTRIVAIRDDLQILINALSNINKLNPGEEYKDDNGIVIGVRLAEYNDVRYTTAYTELLNAYDAISSYISSQEVLDIIDKTCITFTLGQFGKNYVTDGYTFSFENKSYTMKSTASPERLAEYVYGGSFLAKFGVPASYTNAEYNGFIESYRVYDSEEKTLKTKLNIWTELRTFASELANYTSRLYYLTNMNDLSNNVGDGILLTSKIYNHSTWDTEATDIEKTLEQIILEYLLSSDLSADTLLRLSFGDTIDTLDALGCADDIKALAYYLEGKNYKTDRDGKISLENGCPIILVGTNENEYNMTSYNKKVALKKYLDFVASNGYNSNGYYNDGNDTPAQRIHKIFKKVISYLIVTEEEGETTSENAINLDNITYKDFRQILMKALSDYQKNPSESDIENQDRYITLFNLVTAQFDYTYSVSASSGSASAEASGGTTTSTVNAGTSISSIYLESDANGIMYYKTGNGRSQLHATFSTDISTRDIILTLAGVDNRPIEELVGLEYDSLYDRNGNYDEANGDVFVLTTYIESEGKYYPILTRNSKQQIASNDKYFDYISHCGVSFTTKYYAPDYVYPVIAKGVIDASGYPTAIKMVDNEIVFYRTSITTSAKINDEAVQRTRASSEVTTIGYTKYVDLSYAKPKSSNSMAMFAGSTSMEYAVKGSYSAKFIQYEESYSVTDPDNFDSIMVLDKFSAFYTLEIKQYFMFMLGFATLIPMLFKASAAVMRRVLDLIFLILAGPVVISTTAINPETKGKANTKIFDTWKSNLSDTLLHVFGYMIAFNIYYILTSTVMNMDFVSDSTMAVLDKVGGLTSLLSRESINALIRYVYLVAAAGTIETSADLLVGIVTGGKSQHAFSTQISGEVFADVKQVVTEAREIYDNVTSVASGKSITQIKDFALQSAKNMIPGGQIVAGAIHKGQDLATGIKAKGLEKSAIANGMSPEVAKKMSKQFADNEKGQRQQKRENSANNANKFMKSALGINGVFDESGGKKGKGGKDKAPKKPKAPKDKKDKKGKGKKK